MLFLVYTLLFLYFHQVFVRVELHFWLLGSLYPFLLLFLQVIFQTSLELGCHGMAFYLAHVSESHERPISVASLPVRQESDK